MSSRRLSISKTIMSPSLDRRYRPAVCRLRGDVPRHEAHVSLR